MMMELILVFLVCLGAAPSTTSREHITLPCNVCYDGPSASPTSIPSFAPSYSPTHTPSYHPTHTPTQTPTQIPSYTPSHTPSYTPTHTPTSFPPTPIPTHTPSTQAPSFDLASYTPTFEPSSIPTPTPSTRYSPTAMERGSRQLTTYGCLFAENISYTIECPVNNETCNYYSTSTITVGTDASINTSSTCTLSFAAAISVVFQKNSRVETRAFNVTAPTITVESGAILTTSGWGISDGPGSGTNVADGGSYGGSGGASSSTCSSPYCIGNNVIGQIDTCKQIETNPEEALGSGGGIDGPAGGGWVYLSGSDITIDGNVDCNGGNSSYSFGAGSGGSVCLNANSLDGSGGISAIGGASQYSTSAAGGGGRITIRQSSTTATLTTLYHGGLGQSNCSTGGSGTFLDIDYSIESFVLRLDNVKYVTFAMTPVTSGADLSGYTITELDVNAAAVLGSRALTVQGGLSVVEHSILADLPDSFNTVDAYSGSFGIPTLEVNAQTLGLSTSTLHAVNVTLLVSGTCNISQSMLDLQGIVVQAATFTLDSASSLNFETVANVTADKYASFHGPVIQSYNVGAQSGLSVFATGNVTVSEISVNTVWIYSGGSVTLAGSVIASRTLCEATLSTTGDCTATNTTLFVSTPIAVTISDTVQASVLCICSGTISVSSSASLNTDWMGCPAQSGPGAGSTSPNGGSSGAGYGGSGGAGGNSSRGGASYGSDLMILYPGSGGGGSLGGAGGGIIKMQAVDAVVMDGGLSSNGGPGQGDAGGGSGGSVFISTNKLHSQSSEASMFANGGDGGDDTNYGGGGGGGGRIIFLNGEIDYDQPYDFYGVLRLHGGFGGSGTYLGVPGVNGSVTWPVCPPGYGNEYTDVELCKICSKGYYNDEWTAEECRPCSNKPSHSSYEQVGEQTSDCVYECSSGYVSEKCVTPLMNFIDAFGGVLPFSIYMSICFAIVLACMGCLRYSSRVRKRLKEGRYYKFGTFFEQFFSSVDRPSSADTFPDPRNASNTAPVQLVSDSGQLENDLSESLLANNRTKTGVTFTRDAEGHPIRLRRTKSNDDDVCTSKLVQWMLSCLGLGLVSDQTRVGRHSSMLDQRAVLRLQKGDLPVHAGRVYLLGRNSPFVVMGGPWVMSARPPKELEPMFYKSRYAELAGEVNRFVAWRKWGWESIVFVVLVIFAPPFAPYFLAYRREVRGRRFLKMFASLRYDLFRSPRIAALKNHVRVGVSPDASVAYIDFLYDEEPLAPFAPICRVGQPRTPIAFRFSGQGNYYFPWFVDSNDIIVQCIPSIPALPSFIDQNWLDFVHQLNSRLRTLRHSNIQRDIRLLLKFLSKHSGHQSLGGLRVDFCVFWTTLPSDLEYPIQEESDPKWTGTDVTDKVKINSGSGDSFYVFDAATPKTNRSETGRKNTRKRGSSRNRVMVYATAFGSFETMCNGIRDMRAIPGLIIHNKDLKVPAFTQPPTIPPHTPSTVVDQSSSTALNVSPMDTNQHTSRTSNIEKMHDMAKYKRIIEEAEKSIRRQESDTSEPTHSHPAESAIVRPLVGTTAPPTHTARRSTHRPASIPELGLNDSKSDVHPTTHPKGEATLSFFTRPTGLDDDSDEDSPRLWSSLSSLTRLSRRKSFREKSETTDSVQFRNDEEIRASHQRGSSWSSIESDPQYLSDARNEALHKALAQPGAFTFEDESPPCPDDLTLMLSNAQIIELSELVQAANEQSYAFQYCPRYASSAQAFMTIARQFESSNVHFKSNFINTSVLWAGVTILVLMDLALSVTCFASFVCVSTGHSTCDLTAAFVILCIYPLAIFAGPCSGLIAVSVGTFPPFLRIHVGFTLLSLLNVMCMLFLSAAYWNELPVYVFPLIMSLFIIKRLEISAQNMFIAARETRRTSKGWDGLPSSAIHHPQLVKDW